MLKVLFVISRLERGGAEQQLALLAEGLRGRQCDVRVCALAGGGTVADKLTRGGIPVEVLGLGYQLDPRPLWRLSRRIGHFAPDIVHTFRPTGNCLGRWVACRHPEVRVVASAHAAEDVFQAWQRWCIRRLHRRTSRWIVPSPSLREHWLADGVPAERLAVIPPAAAPNGQAPNLAALRKSLRIPDGAPIVACVGRLVPHKGTKDALWAADILKFVHDQLYLLVIGDGPQRHRLERFARDIELAQRVRFLGHRDDVPDLLRLADIVWFPGHTDHLPISVLEAMALGRPVVAARLPALADVVRDGQTGFLVPVRDKPAFAQRTRRLLDDPDLYQQIAEAARQHVAAHFGVERFVDAHLNLYQQALNGQVREP